MRTRSNTAEAVFPQRHKKVGDVLPSAYCAGGRELRPPIAERAGRLAVLLALPSLGLGVLVRATRGLDQVLLCFLRALRVGLPPTCKSKTCVCQEKMLLYLPAGHHSCDPAAVAPVTASYLRAEGTCREQPQQCLAKMLCSKTLRKGGGDDDTFLLISQTGPLPLGKAV